MSSSCPRSSPSTSDRRPIPVLHSRTRIAVLPEWWGGPDRGVRGFGHARRMSRNIELGQRGERIAADFLIRAGHVIRDRNWRCPRGALDLVTRDAGAIVAVEVKTRRSLDYGHPFEAIDRRKLERLYRLGRDWCAAHDAPAGRLRVDAIAIVTGDGSTAPSIEHLEWVR